MPKLQLALDAIGLEDALTLLGRIRDHVDIIEIGTPFLMEYGLEAIRRVKAALPRHEVLCDGKIMDAGDYEARQMFAAGADYVTVLAVTDEQTVAACVKAAREHGGKVMADMICANGLAGTARRMEALGADVVAVHTGVDQQAVGRTPLQDLAELKQCVRQAQVAVAGGIRADTVEAYLRLAPDIVIVGGGILSQPDRVSAAETLYRAIHGNA
ncbi:MAG: 3-hexulose-6-phosphate synthase [Clostridiales bacterium]|nr:3-hexulose-6-phosphate synthase [Clostridiales bacterium]